MFVSLVVVVPLAAPFHQDVTFAYNNVDMDDPIVANWGLLVFPLVLGVFVFHAIICFAVRKCCGCCCLEETGEINEELNWGKL